MLQQTNELNLNVGTYATNMLADSTYVSEYF